MSKRKIFTIIIIILVIIILVSKILKKGNVESLDEQILYVSSTKNVIVIFIRIIDKGISFVIDLIFSILLKIFGAIFGF
ncbi:MAG: hypothetical protein ACI35W_01100 [Anaeroplasmataceae bacterium]